MKHVLDKHNMGLFFIYLYFCEEQCIIGCKEEIAFCFVFAWNALKTERHPKIFVGVTAEGRTDWLSLVCIQIERAGLFRCLIMMLNMTEKAFLGLREGKRTCCQVLPPPKKSIPGLFFILMRGRKGGYFTDVTKEE